MKISQDNRPFECIRMPRHVEFELFPGRTLDLFLFQDVQNHDDLLKRVRNAELELSFLNAEMVIAMSKNLLILRRDFG